MMHINNSYWQIVLINNTKFSWYRQLGAKSYEILYALKSEKDGCHVMYFQPMKINKIIVICNIKYN